MNDFVKYLNGLHNYNAQNQNAYGEKMYKAPIMNVPRFQLIFASIL